MADRRQKLVNQGIGSADLTFPDNEKLYFGTDKDSAISFDGTDLCITGTPEVFIKNSAGAIMLNLQDTGGAGSAANPLMGFWDSAGTRLGFVGYASVASSDLYLGNDADGGNIVLRCDNSSATKIEMARFDPDGDITFKGPAAATNVKITATGDASLIIEADSDNVTETDNPWLQFRQDGGAIEAQIGLTGAINVDGEGNTFTGIAQNSLAIHYETASAGGEIGLGVNGVCPVIINDSDEFIIQNSGGTDYVKYNHDGTDFYTTYQNTTWHRFVNIANSGGSGGWIFDDGGAVYIRDTTGADSVAMSHDGTDFNSTFAGTTDWNITSATNIKMDSLGGSTNLYVYGDSSTDYIYLSGTSASCQIGSTNHMYYRQATGYDHLFYSTSAGTDYGPRVRFYSGTQNQYYSVRAYDAKVQFIPDEDTGGFEVFKSVSIADDGTATFTSSRGHCIWIVKNTWDDSADGMFASTGQSVTKFAGGANFQLGDNGTNPNIDGDVNCYMSASGVLSIKNRTAATHSFSVTCFLG